MHSDYKALQAEFVSYRQEKLDQEHKRDEQMTGVERQLQSLTK
jgi:hypothetical protein